MLLSDCSLYSNVAGFQYDYSLTEVNASYSVAGWGAFCPWQVATLLMESRQGEPFSQTAMPGSIPAHGGVINSGLSYCQMLWTEAFQAADFLIPSS